jgi:Protein of unknown function (DUF3429)
MMGTANQGPPSSAQWLGYAGLIPFVALSAATWWLESTHRATSQSALLAYSAAILSFLGAIHWGLAMREKVPPTALLLWGVMPSLVAWAALLMPVQGGLWLESIALWLCFAVDKRIYPTFGLPHWLRMRLVLTFIASMACSAAALV